MFLVTIGRGLKVNLYTGGIAFFCGLFSCKLVVMGLTVRCRGLYTILIGCQLTTTIGICCARTARSRQGKQVRVVVVLVKATVACTVHRVLCGFFIRELVQYIISVPCGAARVLFLPLFLSFLATGVCTSTHGGLRKICGFTIFF